MRDPSHRYTLLNPDELQAQIIEMRKTMAVLQENVKELQQQLQKSYIRIKELQENYKEK